MIDRCLRMVYDIIIVNLYTCTAVYAHRDTYTRDAGLKRQILFSV